VAYARYSAHPKHNLNLKRRPDTIGCRQGIHTTQSLGDEVAILIQHSFTGFSPIFPVVLKRPLGDYGNDNDFVVVNQFPCSLVPPAYVSGISASSFCAFAQMVSALCRAPPRQFARLCLLWYMSKLGE